MNHLEDRRSRLQIALDDLKTRRERNVLGQFATPGPLALEIVRATRGMLDEDAELAFLDPAFGTGAFYSALLRVFPPGEVKTARGHEIDAHYGAPARELWEPTGLALDFRDFTTVEPPRDDGMGLVDLIVCNPPYVRHHHIVPATKTRLAAQVYKELGIRVSGLAGLYVYFMLLGHKWLNPDAMSAWLVPSEFMDVNYGSAVKRYLLAHVDLLRVHRFDPAEVQFGDALVSSAVVWFRNRAPGQDGRPEFTFGGSIAEPRSRCRVTTAELRDEPKWTRFPDPYTRATETLHTNRGTVLGDFFSIRRGIVTGANRFFVVDEAKAAALSIPSRFLTPVLPSPRHLGTDVVNGDDRGNPQLDRKLFLFDCHVRHDDLAKDAPGAAAYLTSGEDAGLHKGYLALRRNPWYAQEHRDPTPFLCTYMGRSSCGKAPFRVIHNRSQAIATNVYLMLYPKGRLSQMAQDASVQDATWASLRRIVEQEWRWGGRTYGGGLHKVEPGELARFPADALLDDLPELRSAAQPSLL